MTSLCPLNFFSAGKVLLSSGGTFLLPRCHLYGGVTNVALPDEFDKLLSTMRSREIDETDGWMECESCHNAVQILKHAKGRRVPVYQMADCNLLVPLSKKR